MAEEGEPASGQSDDPTDADTRRNEKSLTDLIDEIERAAFQRALDGRHYFGREPGENEAASI
jgi:hypothetical protein